VEHGLLLLARRCGLQVAESRLTRVGDADVLLADELRRVSAQPVADLRELFGRICFNAAVSNIDDHPRNHALLARSRSWQLSPAYDLTPAPPAGRDPPRPGHGLWPGGAQPQPVGQPPGDPGGGGPVSAAARGS
jgi:hypothetical protein